MASIFIGLSFRPTYAQMLLNFFGIEIAAHLNITGKQGDATFDDIDIHDTRTDIHSAMTSSALKS